MYKPDGEDEPPAVYVLNDEGWTFPCAAALQCALCVCCSPLLLPPSASASPGMTQPRCQGWHEPSQHGSGLETTGVVGVLLCLCQPAAVLLAALPPENPSLPLLLLLLARAMPPPVHLHQVALHRHLGNVFLVRLTPALLLWLLLLLLLLVLWGLVVLPVQMCPCEHCCCCCGSG